MTKQFNLDQVLYHFNGKEPLTIRQACEGVMVTGGIGSGKTSGSGGAIAKSYLKAGFGGLVLCAKKDVLDDWLGYAKAANRTDSIIVFDDSGKWRFPFMQYEVNREGAGAGYTQNLVRLFTTIYETLDRSGSAGGSSDPYWSRSMEQLIRNAIDLSLLARGEVSVPLLQEIVNSAPRNPDERDSKEWRKASLCWKLFTEANNKERNHWEQLDFDTTVTYWLEEFTNLAPKTRSGIISMFSSISDNFMRRPFRMLFSEPPSDSSQILSPELTHEGLVIIMNLPIKEYGTAGRVAQLLYKQIWQEAAERRDVKKNPRPVFLWIDEYQNFVTEYDAMFQATARSSKACMVCLSQNLPNLYAEMGGTSSKSRVDALIGNFRTLIFHNNSDPETNQFAAEVIGKSWQVRRGKGMSYGEKAHLSESEQESYDYDFIPQNFSKLLRTGSPTNNFMVDAILFQSGRKWKNKRNYLFTTFNQRI